MSECNASGNPVDPKAADEMLELIKENLRDTDIIVTSGSVPPGVPADFYYKVINEAKSRGIITILDADNQLLAEGVKAAPTLIKPNRNELEKYVGKELATREDIAKAASQLLETGIKYVCVSAGAEGAYLFSDEGWFFADSAPIEVKGVQGAGDFLVAGFAMAMEDGLGPQEMLRVAVAAANGSLTHEGTKLCQREDLEKILPLINAVRIN